MRPPELNIVHLTPGRLALWGKPQASPAFRSPPPWLSRPVPSPFPTDSKTSFRSEDRKEERSYQESAPPPPQYVLEADPDEILFSERKRTIQEFFSELFGTFIMIMFGDGVVAQVVLSKGAKGDFQSINWAWGVAVMIGVFVAKKSGGHLNPAVTLANCVYRRFPWRKFPVYAAAQLLGAMLGAVVVYTNYVSAIDLLEGGAGIRTVVPDSATSTASIFATYPVPFLSTGGQFFSEFLCSAILMFSIFALIDAGLGNMMPLFLLFLIFGIGASFGWETGYAMNLARDFGPRAVCYFIGYGDAVFTAGNTYFWIPLVAPFVGTLFGGLLYDVFLNTGGVSPISTPWTRPSEPV